MILIDKFFCYLPQHEKVSSFENFSRKRSTLRLIIPPPTIAKTTHVIILYQPSSGGLPRG